MKCDREMRRKEGIEKIKIRRTVQRREELSGKEKDGRTE